MIAEVALSPQGSSRTAQFGGQAVLPSAAPAHQTTIIITYIGGFIEEWEEEEEGRKEGGIISGISCGSTRRGEQQLD